MFNSACAKVPGAYPMLLPTFEQTKPWLFCPSVIPGRSHLAMRAILQGLAMCCTSNHLQSALLPGDRETGIDEGPVNQFHRKTSGKPPPLLGWGATLLRLKSPTSFFIELIFYHLPKQCFFSKIQP